MGKKYIIGFIFTSILGVLLHFLYDWSNKNIIIAPLSAVNESIWEHMKILFVPLIIYALLQKAIFGAQINFWQIKLISVFSSIVLIPVLYYGYTAIFNKSADWFNIAIFFIATAAAFYIDYRLTASNYSLKLPPIVFQTILFIMFLTFFVFTFYPPKAELFKDPQTSGYGILP